MLKEIQRNTLIKRLLSKGVTSYSDKSIYDMTIKELCLVNVKEDLKNDPKISERR